MRTVPWRGVKWMAGDFAYAVRVVVARWALLCPSPADDERLEVGFFLRRVTGADGAGVIGFCGMEA